MISGWILKKDRDGQSLYRLETGRAPFIIDVYSQYAGPGTARRAAWGGGVALGGHRTVAWIISMHSTGDTILAAYLTYAFSALLAQLKGDRDHFWSDEYIGDLAYAMMDNLYGNVDA